VNQFGRADPGKMDGLIEKETIPVQIKRIPPFGGILLIDFDTHLYAI
jgi:hypothetical protein